MGEDIPSSAAAAAAAAAAGQKSGTLVLKEVDRARSMKSDRFRSVQLCTTLNVMYGYASL